MAFLLVLVFLGLPVVGLLAVLVLLRYFPAAKIELATDGSDVPEKVASPAREHTPYIVIALLWFSFAVSLLVLILLPADLLNSFSKNPENLVQDVLGVLWLFVFWATFVLTWALVPFYQGFVETGYLTVFDRILDSIRTNLLFYLVVSVLAVIPGVVILIFFRVKFAALLALAFALSNGWGFLLLSLLLGYGFAEWPRQLWITTRLEMRIALGYYQLAKLQENEDSSRITIMSHLASYQSILSGLELGMGSAEQELLDAIGDLVSRTIPVRWRDRVLARTADTEFDGQVTKKSLAKLRYNLVSQINAHHCNRYQFVRRLDKLDELHDLWGLSHQDALPLQAWLASQFRRTTDGPLIPFGEPLVPPGTHGRLLSRQPPMIRLLARMSSNDFATRVDIMWNVTLHKHVLRVIAIAMFLLGLLVTITEVVFWLQAFLKSDIPLNLLALLQRLFVLIPALSLLGVSLLSIPFLYMAWVAFWSFTHLRIFDYYNMVPHHSTPNSMLFAAAYLSRLATPLCFNFLWLVFGSPSNRSTLAFGRVFGTIDLLPLTTFAFLFFALIFAAMFLLTLLDVFSRVLGCFGFTQFTSRDARAIQRISQQSRNSFVDEDGANLSTVDSEKSRRLVQGTKAYYRHRAHRIRVLASDSMADTHTGLAGTRIQSPVI